LPRKGTDISLGKGNEDDSVIFKANGRSKGIGEKVSEQGGAITLSICEEKERISLKGAFCKEWLPILIRIGVSIMTRKELSPNL